MSGPPVSEVEFSVRGFTGFPKGRERSDESLFDDWQVPLILREDKSQVLGILYDFFSFRFIAVLHFF
jgi:hypothetical protein